MQSLARQHVFDFLRGNVNSSYHRPFLSKHEWMFNDDLDRAETWIRYYEHIQQCFDVIMSQCAMLETLFPIILSFLVKGDPPAWIIPPNLQLKWLDVSYYGNQWF